MRTLRRGLAVLVLGVGSYLIAALAGAYIPGSRSPVDGVPDTEILLLRGPIHYDILLPITPEVRARFAWLEQSGLAPDTPGAEWLVIGWGGKTFYTTTGTYRDVSARAIWRSLTGDSAVLRVALAGPRADDWAALPVHLSATQLSALITQIEDTLTAGPGTAPLDHPGFSEFDRFYPAKGRFHILRTCNVWIGDTLRAAGIPFGAWTPTPYAVTRAAAHHLP